jgi:hypothetical protein
LTRRQIHGSLCPISNVLEIDPHIGLIAAMAAGGCAFHMPSRIRRRAFGGSRCYGRRSVVIGQRTGDDHFRFVAAIFALTDFLSDNLTHGLVLLLHLKAMRAHHPRSAIGRIRAEHFIAGRSPSTNIKENPIRKPSRIQNEDAASNCQDAGFLLLRMVIMFLTKKKHQSVDRTSSSGRPPSLSAKRGQT